MRPDQFEALAQLMRLRQSPSHDALHMVMVRGYTHTVAAQQCGIPRQNVSRQVASAKRTIEAARILSAQ